ncbi:MAG: hypothetical protein MI923_18585 [Phycisphaerales bacterium]|nr:hypothetical protein [Phycisphaerales bacterium]
MQTAPGRHRLPDTKPGIIANLIHHRPESHFIQVHRNTPYSFATPRGNHTPPDEDGNMSASPSDRKWRYLMKIKELRKYLKKATVAEFIRVDRAPSRKQQAVNL